MPKIPYAELAGLSGEEFLENCYLRLLRRQIDPTGRAHFLARLEAGEDKSLIIGSLLRSEEGRQAGQQVSGLWTRYWLTWLQRHRVIGLLIPTPPGETRRVLRALENQLYRLMKDHAAPQSGSPAPRPPLRTQPPAPAPQTQSQPQPQTATFAARRSRPSLFLVIETAGAEQSAAAFQVRLGRAFVALGASVVFVRWDAESRHFELVARQDLERLGLAADLGEEATIYPVKREAPVLLAPAFCGGDDWLLVPDAMRPVPDAQSLAVMNAILEARRLGLRSAFVFHGAAPLRQATHSGRDAEAHELYMQALLLADAIASVSAAAAADLAAFLAQHQKAKFAPLTSTIEPPAEDRDGARWPEYAGRVRQWLAEAADPSRRLAALYYWIEPDGAGSFAPRLGRALAECGIALIPAAWDAGRGRFVIAKEPGAGTWTSWIEPGEARSPRWVLRAEEVDSSSLNRAAAWARSKGLRVAALLQEPADGARGEVSTPASDDRGLYEALASLDKVLAVSARRHRAFQRFLLSWRGRVHSAEHRFKALDGPGHPSRSWHDCAREIVAELAADRPADGLRPLVAPPGADAYTAMASLRRRPKLSLCISTYNRGGWVEVNLRNIFTQVPVPRDDLEVLVVDNASSDDTPARVKPWLGRSDFRFVRNAKNVGMLGNLAVTAQRARGQFVWILGDDDLTRPGTIERILRVIEEYPDVGLIYLNYGYSSEADPGKVTDFPTYLANYNVLEPAGSDELATVKRVAARTENFFTAIYCIVFRRDHALKAYCQDTSGRIFSTMLSCVPSAYYVLNYMAEESAYWLGEPALVVNSNVSWQDYGVLLDLEQLPRAWDLAERMGADPAEVDRRRANRLWLIEMMWKEIFENDKAGNSAYFSAPRVLMRLKHLQELEPRIPEFLSIYERARSAGHPAAAIPAGELFGAFKDPRKS